MFLLQIEHFTSMIVSYIILVHFFFVFLNVHYKSRAIHLVTIFIGILCHIENSYVLERRDVCQRVRMKAKDITKEIFASLK